MPRPPLPRETQLFWDQTRTALSEDRLPDAQRFATLAVACSGWDAYATPTVISGVHLATCPLLPPEWVYYEDTGRWDQLVLFHPGASEFMVWSTGLPEMMKVLYANGQGLIRLERLLAAAVLSDLSPLDASG